MNCRIRFIRVDGRKMQVGANYNVVKDKSMDEPILRLIDVAKTLLEVEIKIASRLLSKAEKLDILKSVGKTKNKVYFKEFYR